MCHALLSCFSRVWLSATLRTVTHQASLSVGFSRQQYWTGLPRPPPGCLPDPGVEPASLTAPAMAGRFFTTRATFAIKRIRGRRHTSEGILDERLMFTHGASVLVHLSNLLLFSGTEQHENTVHLAICLNEAGLSLLSRRINLNSSSSNQDNLKGKAS